MAGKALNAAGVCGSGSGTKLVEATGDLLKDKMGNQLGEAREDLETAIGEELRPRRNRRTAYGPWFHARGLANN